MWAREAAAHAHKNARGAGMKIVIGLQCLTLAILCVVGLYVIKLSERQVVEINATPTESPQQSAIVNDSTAEISY